MWCWVPVVMFACLAFAGERAEAETALASWYGYELAGSPTASGEPYEPMGYTAAHKTLPLGTQLVVSYGGSSVQVTVNDRGPYVAGRELDLSQGAASAIGLDQAGVDYVDYSYADPGAGYAAPATQSVEQPQYADPAQSANAQSSTQGATYATQPAADYGNSAVSASGGYDGGTGAYVVQEGETLTSIAAELGTSVEAIAAANGIADPDVIWSGQTLNL